MRARIIDKDGGYSEYSRSVIVVNIPPTAAFHAPASVITGRVFGLVLADAADAADDCEATNQRLHIGVCAD